MTLRQREKYKKLVAFFQGFIILAAEIVMFSYVWYEYYEPSFEADTFRGADIMMVAVYGIIVFIFTKLYGGYKFGYLQTMDMIYSQIISIVCANVVAYIQLCMVCRELIQAFTIILLTLLEMALIIFYNTVMSFVLARIYPPRKMLLVYGDKGPMELLNTLHTRPDKFSIEESIHANSDKDVILHKALKYDGVVIHRVQPELRNELLRLCFEHEIRSYVVPNIADIILWSGENIHLFDTPLILTRNHGIGVIEGFFKRCMDIVISLIMLIILSPLMLIIALCVKLYDKGPVLYKQERVTKDKRVFLIYKFRSMRVDSETEGARLARKNDERITPVGKILRNLHLDELPQLINVLKGEMSMVGPRPERPEIIEKYRREIPEFDYRLKVKAGLTGYAQVYGRYKTTSYNKLKLDLMYIEHYSIWLDIKILFFTFKILFIKENSEGVDE